jgi:hypothetical protein
MKQLTCKQCGANIVLTYEMEKFSCVNCSTEWKVKKDEEGNLDLDTRQNMGAGASLFQFISDQSSRPGDEERLEKLQVEISELEELKSKAGSFVPGKIKNPCYYSHRKTTATWIAWATAAFFFILMLSFLAHQLLLSPGDRARTMGAYLLFSGLLAAVYGITGAGLFMKMRNNPFQEYKENEEEKRLVSQGLNKINMQLAELRIKKWEIENRRKPPGEDPPPGTEAGGM